MKALQLYLDHLADRVSRVRLFGKDKDGKDIVRALEKVFVELTVTEEYERPAFHLAFLGMMDANLRRQREIFGQHEAEQGEQFADTGSQKIKRLVKPIELLRNGTHIVVTGAPGCGKTTLLRYLAWRIYKENLRWPVFLELKTINETDFTNAAGRLEEIIFEKAIISELHFNDEEKAALRQHFISQLSEGAVTILLDGLDEVRGEIFFKDLCQSVEKFIRSDLRQNTVIVSTRPYALHRTRIEDIKEMEIAPLNDRQIAEFLRHYYGNDEVVNRLKRTLRGQRPLREMARVPFLLAVMADLIRRKQEIGSNRLDLFRAIARQLVVQLDNEKKVQRFAFQIEDPHGKIKLNFLKHLAFERLLRDDLTQEGADSEAARLIFTDQVIQEKARQFVKTEYLPNINYIELANDVKGTPLLREIDEDVYSFTHLTTQEYLAAEALVAYPDCLRIFCQTFFNSTLVEMEVLPMALGLLPRADEFYATLETLPESLTFANLRLRARGLCYGAKITPQQRGNTLVQFSDFFWEYHNEYSYESIEVSRGKDFVDYLYKDAVLNSFAGVTDAEDFLLQILKDRHKHYDVTLRRAVEVLGRIGSEHSVSGLLELLNSKDEELRWKAVNSLGRLGSEDAVDGLLHTLRDESSSIRWRSGQALSVSGSDHALQGLLQALDDDNYFVRLCVTEALGAVGSERALDGVLRSLADENAWVRRSAVEALRSFDSKRAQDGLWHVAVKDESDGVRWRAARALGLPNTETHPAQEKTARGSSHKAELINNEQSRVNDLLNALTSDNWKRKLAAAELAKIEASILRSGLETELNNVNQAIRLKVVQIVGYCSDDPRILNELSKLAEHDYDSDVRDAAREASEKFARKLELLGYSTTEDTVQTLSDNESRELFLVGEAFKVVAEAGHIFRPTHNSDWGIDGEIEFKDEHGEASGRRVYLQLKSGDSYLRTRKSDRKEIFTVKARHAKYWQSHAYPVLLVIRNANGQIRWMNVTAYLQRHGTNIKQIEFQGEPFTAESVKQMRDRFAR
ncbi:MAG: HEAT repeat domain-containing protein [Acidobacteria bacterium]|nr:HEAT repeat domain-containing protein [Acidobacteriota bacterium]